MKRCPTCNQTFSEGWLSFCTQDGTTLIEDSVSRDEPPATIMAPPPRVTSPNQPASWNPPLGGVGSGPFPQQQPVYQQPQPMQAGWQPPPPPAYAPRQGLAIASMILGIFTITFGWCYLGVITGPIAIGLGIYALIQVKNHPDKFAGKPVAVAGIVMGALFLLIVAFLLLLYGVGVAMR